jgi:hypothetical protein
MEEQLFRNLFCCSPRRYFKKRGIIEVYAFIKEHMFFLAFKHEVLIFNVKNDIVILILLVTIPSSIVIVNLNFRKCGKDFKYQSGMDNFVKFHMTISLQQNNQYKIAIYSLV